jgi:predicted transcriptional regulator
MALFKPKEFGFHNCRYCGTELIKKSSFCHICGRPRGIEDVSLSKTQLLTLRAIVEKKRGIDSIAKFVGGDLSKDVLTSVINSLIEKGYVQKKKDTFNQKYVTTRKGFEIFLSEEKKQKITPPVLYQKRLIRYPVSVFGAVLGLLSIFLPWIDTQVNRFNLLQYQDIITIFEGSDSSLLFFQYGLVTVIFLALISGSISMIYPVGSFLQLVTWMFFALIFTIFVSSPNNNFSVGFYLNVVGSIVSIIGLSYKREPIMMDFAT